jgi:hypothetical protein
MESNTGATRTRTRPHDAMMTKTGKNIIHAKNIEGSAFLIPSVELTKMSNVFGIPPDREKLALKMKEVMGSLLWNVNDSVFVHPETDLHFELDNMGFSYKRGLSTEQEAQLWGYPAATCVLECAADNHLEFWVRRGPNDPKIYLMTDYKNGATHQTTRMREELERMLLLDKKGIQLTVMGEKKTEEASAPAPPPPREPDAPPTPAELLEPSKLWDTSLPDLSDKKAPAKTKVVDLGAL